MRNAQTRYKTIVAPCTGYAFGDIVRQAFDESGMTQREFAKKVGVAQPRIPEIFKSQSITEKLFDRCAAALGLEIVVKLVRVVR